MQVIQAQRTAIVEVVTDEGDCPLYRRCSAEAWENLIGIGWEPVSYWGEGRAKELEAAYQKFLHDAGIEETE